MKDEILPLFRNILLVCEEMNLLGGTFFAQDGCKLSSNASMKWSGKVDDLKRKKDKIEEKVRQILRDQQDQDRRDDDPPPCGNRDKQIEMLTKQAERIAAWVKENDARVGRRGKEIKSNVTDNESAKMVTSHGSMQGYNGQVLVDARHQVIVHGEVFGTSQDEDLIPPIIDGAKENMEKIGHKDAAEFFKGKIFTADSGYHHKGNLQKCIDEKMDAYIPDKRFRTRDVRVSESRRKTRTHFALGDFSYDKDKDQYICPNGKVLRFKTKHHVSYDTVYQSYRAKEEDCRGCGMRQRCIYGEARGPKNLSVPIGTYGINLSKLMVEKIESEEGRRIYPLRMAIVEPVFGNIRTNKRLGRFTLRGKIKVNI